MHTSASNTFCAGERATAYDRMSAKVGDTHDDEQEALQSTPKVLSWLANKSVSKSPHTTSLHPMLQSPAPSLLLPSGARSQGQNRRDSLLRYRE